jgi:hypothetical protein
MANIYGTSASETVFGSPQDDEIRSYGGDDVIYAGEGNDRIITAEARILRQSLRHEF